MTKEDAEIERAYCRLVRKMNKLVVEMEDLGENDMGLLHRRLAGRYHRITQSLRLLTIELMQDVQWPHEPGINREAVS